MGDRGNIICNFGEKDKKPQCVWFYAHWSGSDLPNVVHRALSRRQRWDDSNYLARIIFCEMVKGSEADECGFGLGLDACDNNHNFVEVDMVKKMVRFLKYDWKDNFSHQPGATIKEWTFEKYILADVDKINQLFNKE